MKTMTGLLLALASTLSSVSYFMAADSCWFTRMTSAERPPCCDLGGRDRFTMPGGDCCKTLHYEAAELVELTEALADIAPAAVAPFEPAALVHIRPGHPLAIEPRARPPPPPTLPLITRTIVLRV